MILRDAAKSLGYDSYTSNNIKVRDPAQGGEFVGDDVEAGAATWEVLITTQEPSHAEEILAEMKKRYTSEVFLPQAKEVGERFAQKAWLRALAAMVASLIGIVALHLDSLSESFVWPSRCGCIDPRCLGCAWCNCREFLVERFSGNHFG